MASSLLTTGPALGPLGSDGRAWREIRAPGRDEHSDLLLSATLAGLPASCLWGVPGTTRPPGDSQPALSPGARSSVRLTSLPVCAAPPGSLGPVTLDPVFRLCSRRYCAEDSPSFPRPSLLESHISLMHGIRNPDLSQTSKVRPPGGHSPQVSVGPLPLGVTCSGSVSSRLQGPMCDSGHGAAAAAAAASLPAAHSLVPCGTARR